MRIVIVAAGTWGDVRPNVVLGVALQKAGYDVVLVATEPFRQWVTDHGIAFEAVSIDIQAVLDKFMASDTNFFATMQTLRQVVKDTGPAMVQVGKDIAAVVREGDVLLANEIGMGWLNGIVEKYHLRLICINFQPQVPTAEVPGMSMPALPTWMPMRRAYNRFSYNLFRGLSWTMQGRYGNQLRSEHLAIPKQTWAKQRAMLDSSPSLLLVSRHVVPQPSDWEPQHRVTGYIFDEDTGWEPPQALLDFLEAGEKPIYIGFGSMGDRKPEAMTRLVLEAVRRTGKRAILLSGWAKIGSQDLPDNVFLLKYASHRWLFPRMAATVHHGGAGTTAAGIAAGVPAIIVPFFVDQPYWGRRVHELGVGTKPIPHGKLTAEKLAAAIDEATSTPAMVEKAAALSQKIATEDGVGDAVKAIQELLA